MSTINVNTINPQSGTEVSVGGSVSGSSRAIFVTGLTTAGPLNVTGTVTAPGIVSGSRAGAASYLAVDSNNQLVLDSIPGGGSVSAVANGSDNRIATFSSATALNKSYI